MFKTNPITGRKYAAKYFNVECVLTLLLVAGVEITQPAVEEWTPQQRREAGDWALRTHLRASDNLNRVPPRPEHVPDFAKVNPDATTVMELYGK